MGRKLSDEQVKAAADRAEGKKPNETGPGRPPKYKPEYAEQAAKLCKLGATDADLADFFEVSIRTVERWRTSHEAFGLAVRQAKDEADSRVERSLFQRAVGYSHDAVKIMQHQGEVLKVDYREHFPPDTTAAIFWLKNRKPEEWRDRTQHEHSGPDGAPIEMQNVSPRKRRAALALALARKDGE